MSSLFAISPGKLSSWHTGIVVEDARTAFKTAVENGGIAVHQPTALKDADEHETVMAEVAMYGDVVMRFMSGNLQVRLSSSRPRCTQSSDTPTPRCLRP